MTRFGQESLKTIDENIQDVVPKNTVKSKQSIWKQFDLFCKERGYVLDCTTTDETLVDILKDWGFNMKRVNGEDYKEHVVKTLWNQTAKLLQEKYSREFSREIDPFKSLKFKPARDARDSKRRLLQAIPEKRKNSAPALEKDELQKLVEVWDEETPEGLQKKFFLIASVELAWRGNEGSSALIHHFKPELRNDGTPTGRIEYNPVFTKTTQGGAKKCAQSKWLMANLENSAQCPVRLYHKLISKRGEKVKTESFFLTPNPFWKKEVAHSWYKNCAIGRNTYGSWMKESATKAGFDTENRNFTNHSSRATAVSALSKSGAGEQEIMKITGHANANSLKPYLQLDDEHHEKLIKKIRTEQSSSAALHTKPLQSTDTFTAASESVNVSRSISGRFDRFRFTPRLSTHSKISSELSHTIVSSQSVNHANTLPGPSDLPQIAAGPVDQSRIVAGSSNQSEPVAKQPNVPTNVTYVYNNCIFNCTNLHINSS